MHWKVENTIKFY